MFSNYGAGVKTMKRSAVLSKVKGDSEAQDFFNICFDSTDKAATMTLKVFKDLLDYPVYTKPRVFRGLEVPAILLSGDHKKIAEYRKSEQIRVTKEKRPDLLK